MKTRLLIIALLASASSFCLAENAGTVSSDTVYEEIALRSEWWPVRVKLVEDYTVTVKGTESVLRKGRPAIFVAPAPDGAWVDFGSFGVHEVPYVVTDIKQSVMENKQSRNWDSNGVLTMQLSNKFFWPENLEQISPWTFQDTDYLLLSYLNIGSDEAVASQKALVDAYESLSNQHPELAFASIPLDESKPEMLADLPASGITWPVMFQYMSEGYINALHHEPVNPTAVLVDKNGRVIAKWGQSQMESSSFASSVEDALGSDVALRKSLKN